MASVHSAVLVAEFVAEYDAVQSYLVLKLTRNNLSLLKMSFSYCMFFHLFFFSRSELCPYYGYIRKHIFQMGFLLHAVVPFSFYLKYNLFLSI